MDSTQIDRDLEDLQVIARRLNRLRADLSYQQIGELAGALSDLAPLYQILPAEILPADVVRLMMENRRTRALLEAIFDANPSGLAVVVGPDLKFMYANPVYRYACPYTKTDLIGLPYEQVWAGDPTAANAAALGDAATTGGAAAAARIRETLETGRPFQMTDFTRVFPDGSRRVFIFQVRRIRWDHPSGEYAALLALWDITERIEIEEALIASEKRIQDLIHYAPAGIYEIDFRSQRFVSVNDRMCHLTGYTREELLAMRPFDLLDDAGKALFQQRTQRWLAADKPDQNVEYQVTAKDGHKIHVLLNVTFKADAAGRPVGATVVGFDITEWKESERALLEAARKADEAALVIELHHRLIDHREKERLKIASDIHDGPLQDLLAAGFDLQILRDDLPPEQAGKLLIAQDALISAITGLRAFAQDLRPPALAEFGLEQAIRSHLKAFREKYPNLHVRLAARLPGSLLPADTRLALYRIYQQAMNNLVRHSGATEVTIRLETAEAPTPEAAAEAPAANMVYLEIRDNGRGFTPPDHWQALANQGHLGLIGMRERAEAVGGQLEVHSQPGAGATICVWVPIAKKAG